MCTDNLRRASRAKAALAALDTANVNLALPYAPATAESEIKAAFTQSLKVRVLGQRSDRRQVSGLDGAFCREARSH